VGFKKDRGRGIKGIKKKMLKDISRSNTEQKQIGNRGPGAAENP